MPLVTFSYQDTESGTNPIPDSSKPLDKFIQKIALPREAYNKRWWIRSVQASCLQGSGVGANKFFRWLEFRVNELMPENHIMYSLNSEGATLEPLRVLRFYVNRTATDGKSVHPNHYAIVSSPNINLGTHRLDSLELTLEITARNGIDKSVVNINRYEIILEYE
jgi:hypothetical protein